MSEPGAVTFVILYRRSRWVLLVRKRDLVDALNMCIRKQCNVLYAWKLSKPNGRNNIAVVVRSLSKQKQARKGRICVDLAFTRSVYDYVLE